MELLEAANQWIKEKGYRLKLSQQRGWLYLRGTLPPKPDSERDRPYQQRIALKLPTNRRGVELAKKEADRVGKLLELGLFDWSPYIHQRQLISVADWVEKLREEYLAQGGKESTWQSEYVTAFRKLPENQPLSMGLLVKTIKTIEPNTKTRLRVCGIFKRLAQLADMDTAQISPLRGSYSTTSVDPRTLPPDALIAEWRTQIKLEHWRWSFGMLACYGMRPHELFHCDLRDFPTVRIGENTKTGSRFIWPLRPEWAEEWQLHKKVVPKIKNAENLENRELGKRVAHRFGILAFPKPDGGTLRAYDLRHCFARRCFEFKFSPDLSAKLMGHTSQTHCRIYRRWIDESTYKAAYDMAIKASGIQIIPP